MKALIVYDSAYGNTARIVEAIAVGAGYGSQPLHVEAAAAAPLEDCDLLVVGSPTQGGRPTRRIQAYLQALDAGTLAGKYVAAFDTRIDERAVSLPLRLLLRVIGYAAPRIARALTRAGGRLALPPEGFCVTGKEGPLCQGELKRAIDWGRALQAEVSDGRAMPV
jgi:flavodoxin I